MLRELSADEVSMFPVVGSLEGPGSATAFATVKEAPAASNATSFPFASKPCIAEAVMLQLPSLFAFKYTVALLAPDIPRVKLLAPSPPPTSPPPDLENVATDVS